MTQLDLNRYDPVERDGILHVPVVLAIPELVGQYGAVSYVVVAEWEDDDQRRHLTNLVFDLKPVLTAPATYATLDAHVGDVLAVAGHRFSIEPDGSLTRLEQLP